MIIVAGKDPRVLQQLHTFIRDREWAAQYKRTDGVRRDDYRHQRQERIIDERARVDRDFVEAKQEGYRGRQDRMETEKRSERDEYAD